MKPKITRVTCPAGDWVGLYIDGELIEDGHSIPDWLLLNLLQERGLLHHDCLTISDEDMEQGLPQSISLLKPHKES